MKSSKSQLRVWMKSLTLFSPFCSIWERSGYSDGSAQGQDVRGRSVHGPGVWSGAGQDLFLCWARRADLWRRLPGEGWRQQRRREPTVLPCQLGRGIQQRAGPGRSVAFLAPHTPGIVEQTWPVFGLRSIVKVSEAKEAAFRTTDFIAIRSPLSRIPAVRLHWLILGSSPLSSWIRRGQTSCRSLGL